MSSTTTDWSVDHIISQSGCSSPTSPCALVILNTPLEHFLVKKIWPTCQWRACADGGSNRLFDALQEEERSAYIPDLIKGDLDSIRPDVKSFYAAKGVPIVKDADLYATDLIKCILALKEHELAYDLVILGGLSGRLDQTIHTLSQLHKLRHERPRTFVVTEANIAWVLDAGEHRIRIDRSLLGPTCGLLPVGVGSTILTTKGLKWNLGSPGLVSTSNWVEAAEIWIKTTEPIWWSVELRR
ncbi:thiamine pyrophosphokinase Thi80 [Dacryopinax primogenitus]|uniref:Thiamine pyrophosphokinase n=1 Tax=Dacryopinax primogenitus (strain DJM 731) TaxID=1858805 RepID=M5FRE6_DACPD|nr:thiamine pyrophosphokinase Thi80 [Dacryopinax primogenitus]EJT98223.1 thiamine pyrophosphokinase Thi80 [Dacryopinax primogenitus]